MRCPKLLRRRSVAAASSAWTWTDSISDKALLRIAGSSAKRSMPSKQGQKLFIVGNIHMHTSFSITEDGISNVGCGGDVFSGERHRNRGKENGSEDGILPCPIFFFSDWIQKNALHRCKPCNILSLPPTFPLEFSEALKEEK